jgi:hypothetical protein
MGRSGIEFHVYAESTAFVGESVARCHTMIPGTKPNREAKCRAARFLDDPRTPTVYTKVLA